MEPRSMDTKVRYQKVKVLIFKAIQLHSFPQNLTLSLGSERKKSKK